MCVVAVALEAHPHWKLVVAGNRDEFHARDSVPLARWDDGSGIIAGRDLVSGGSWMGVSDSGRMAVVTNIRNADGPDPDKQSRGALVTDWLANGVLPEDSCRFNPFNLVVAEHSKGMYLANRPEPLSAPLGAGVHGFSNAIPNEHWPRKDRLVQEVEYWLARTPGDPVALFELLKDQTAPDRDAQPVFIRSPVYGTRCSTVILVDATGKGQIIEKRFDAEGGSTGETTVSFNWPPARP